MQIAQIGSTKFDTMALAAASLADGQTLSVLRSGKGTDAPAALAKPGKFKVIGSTDSAGGLPKLTIDINTRPAYGKGIINIEDGNIEIGYLHLDGCAVPESNGAGIRINPGAKDIVVHHCRFTNNEDGILTGDGASTLTLSDAVFDGNGKASDPARRGYSHNLYSGAMARLSVTRVSFLNSAYGHDLKSRALVTELTQVVCSGSAQGRALDLPNGGVLHASDCEFRKPSGATQNNLIDIGAEGISDGRKEEYIITNGLFHNDVDPVRDVQYINHRSAVELVLVDPLFTGAAATKDRKQTVLGNVRIVLTGGPLGPRVKTGGDPGATSTMAIQDAGQVTPTTPITNPTPTPVPTTGTTSFALVGDPGAGTWARLGGENDTPTVTDGTIVRYGANNSFLFAKVTGKFTANNTQFGKDPAPGVVKSVDQFTPAAVATTPPVTTVPTSTDLDAFAKWLGTLSGKTVTITVK